jgi:predicted short-subunit dehydrogenase-like oxidoreductase (DUF2520 family)
MINLVLIGSGNLAVQLANAFIQSNKVNLIQRYSRKNTNATYFSDKIPVTDKLSEIKEADIYLLAISDSAISEFSKQLPFKKGLVVHTSGSMPMKALLCQANKGVFYPLQTFSKEQVLNFENIPIALETEKSEDYMLLENLANSLSKNTYPIDSQQRTHLHIAAVFANNFSNHMFKIAKDVCDRHDFSFEILKPIIFETTKKLDTMSPMDAQTGPAKRNDQIVIENHLQQLTGEQKEIYRLISDSISKTYNK